MLMMMEPMNEALKEKNPKIPNSTYAKTLIFDPPSSAKCTASGKDQKYSP